jgi:hypothetical protein
VKLIGEFWVDVLLGSQRNQTMIPTRSSETLHQLGPGQAGVGRVLDPLVAELETWMALSGVARLAASPMSSRICSRADGHPDAGLEGSRLSFVKSATWTTEAAQGQAELTRSFDKESRP